MDADLHRAIVQQLESLHRSGVRGIPHPNIEIPEIAPLAKRNRTERPAGKSGSAGDRKASHAAAKPTEKTGRKATNAVATPAPVGAATADATPFGPEIPAAEKAGALQVLQQEVSGCTKCQLLAESRTQTVFGVGNPNARLAFFGEAPGADEDRQGEPFVGRAGQLLTKIIEACTLSRDDIYILNVLRCRPPSNRNPTPEETQNCRPFFEKQLEIVRPEFICCLGAVATSTLLGTTVPIGRLRGQFHSWRGMQVLATYHPAYLLRNPPAKKFVWEDMQLLMKAMGIQLPTK